VETGRLSQRASPAWRFPTTSRRSPGSSPPCGTSRRSCRRASFRSWNHV